MGAGAVTAKNPAVQRDILAKKKKKGTMAKQTAPVVPKPHADGGDVDGNQNQSTVRPEDEVLHAAPKDSTQLNSVEEEWGFQHISTYFSRLRLTHFSSHQVPVPALVFACGRQAYSKEAIWKNMWTRERR